ncbi:MAG TPA: B12-binding domain-containing protein, partial [Armatimonadota bacterium]|nr:B12-binding domain-containing protein [Armatimonadota bacterium]
MLAASLRTTRLSLAEKLSQARLTLAAEATQRFHELHPDWVAKPGERGGRFCLDDACFHLDFLVGAIHAADPSAFRSYVRWTTGMLQARGIPAASVQEHVEHLFAAAGPFLSASECALLADYAPTADGSQGEIEAGGPHSTPLGLTRDLFVQAILNGSRKAAVGLMMESLRTGSTVTELYVEVLQEALYEVGRRWEANRITVAQE